MPYWKEYLDSRAFRPARCQMGSGRHFNYPAYKIGSSLFCLDLKLRSDLECVFIQYRIHWPLIFHRPFPQPEHNGIDGAPYWLCSSNTSLRSFISLQCGHFFWKPNLICSVCIAFWENMGATNFLIIR